MLFAACINPSWRAAVASPIKAFKLSRFFFLQWNRFFARSLRSLSMNFPGKEYIAEMAKISATAISAAFLKILFHLSRGRRGGGYVQCSSKWSEKQRSSSGKHRLCRCCCESRNSKSISKEREHSDIMHPPQYSKEYSARFWQGFSRLAG